MMLQSKYSRSNNTTCISSNQKQYYKVGVVKIIIPHACHPIRNDVTPSTLDNIEPKKQDGGSIGGMEIIV